MTKRTAPPIGGPGYSVELKTGETIHTALDIASTENGSLILRAAGAGPTLILAAGEWLRATWRPS